MVHVSNRYPALEPVLGKTLHLIALKQFSLSDRTPFKSGSGLVVNGTHAGGLRMAGQRRAVRTFAAVEHGQGLQQPAEA